MILTECKALRQEHPTVRTLIVDDSQFVLSQFRSLLDCCLRINVVASAENGHQAIELVRLHRPDLVLMDLQMPGMDGFEAASRILEEFPATRVVHITTHAGPGVERASRQSGARFLLPKAQFVTRFCDVFQELFDACPVSQLEDEQ